MGFELQDLSRDDLSRFEELVRCMWITYESPPQHLYYMFCPLNPVGAETKEEAIQESINRYWEWYKDPSFLWQTMVDKDTDTVVGAALWQFSLDPAREAEDEDAYWHPEGSQREFANQVLEVHGRARARLGTRPHMYLNIILVRPDYQRRGLGTQMMDWAVRKADELGLEMWLEAWQFGRRLYDKFGFTVVEHHHARPAKQDPDEVWRECERQWTELEEWVMWRPPGGPFVEGATVKPWEVMDE